MVKAISGEKQYSTFYVAGRLYGFDVMKVQEITRALPTTRVPLAPNFVYGLINLRGQISTAVGLRELFSISGKMPDDPMNVVCRVGDILFSFVVDKIGDVMELSEDDWEPAPDTVPESIRRFMSGVYKTQGNLLSILEVDKLVDVVLLNNEKEPVTTEAKLAL